LMCCMPSVRLEKWRIYLEMVINALWKLRERQVKLSASIYENFAGSQRQMVMQKRTVLLGAT
jgi:hypothetical protein